MVRTIISGVQTNISASSLGSSTSIKTWKQRQNAREKNMKNAGKNKQQTQTLCLSDKKKVHNHHSQQIHEKDEIRQKLCCSLRFPGCSFYTVVERFSVFCLEFLQIQVPAIAEEMETPDQRMGPLWAAYQTRKRLTRATGPQILVVNKFLNHSIAGYPIVTLYPNIPQNQNQVDMDGFGSKRKRGTANVSTQTRWKLWRTRIMDADAVSTSSSIINTIPTIRWFLKCSASSKIGHVW